MKTYISILFIGFLLVNCTHGGHITVDQMITDAASEVESLSPDSVMKIMEGEAPFTLIDVRQKDEYYYGFIPGSVNVPRGSIEFNINKEDFWEHEGLYLPIPSDTMILYCKKGKRSILAAKTLKQMGYKKVFIIDGGWKNWELTFPDFCDKNLEALGGGSDKHDDGGGC